MRRNPFQNAEWAANQLDQKHLKKPAAPRPPRPPRPERPPRPSRPSQKAGPVRVKKDEFRPGGAFDEAPYLIATSDGRHETVDGYIHRDGVLALHSSDRVIVITHLPSGSAVAHFPAWKLAEAFVLDPAISTLHWDSGEARTIVQRAYARVMHKQCGDHNPQSQPPRERKR
jgi:hypothetical protein